MFFWLNMHKVGIHNLEISEMQIKLIKKLQSPVFYTAPSSLCNSKSQKPVFRHFQAEMWLQIDYVCLTGIHLQDSIFLS